MFSKTDWLFWIFPFSFFLFFLFDSTIFPDEAGKASVSQSIKPEQTQHAEITMVGKKKASKTMNKDFSVKEMFWIQREKPSAISWK